MGRRTWALIAVLLLIGGCGGGASAEAADTVAGLVEEMKAQGIPCSDLVFQDPEPDNGGGVVLGIRPEGPAAIKVGSCRLDGAPEVDGVPLDTRILAFSDNEHLNSLPPPEILVGQSLVYGEKWEIYVIPADKGDEVQSATGGKLIEGSQELPFPTPPP